MELPDTMRTDFPEPNDVLNFNLTIEPDEGEQHANRLKPRSLTGVPCTFRHVQDRFLHIHIRSQQ